MRFEETRTFKAFIILLATVGNIAFYTWGDPSGAESAMEVGWAFYAMIQAIFLAVIGSYTYFLIKNV
jgi:hypothetical protein